MGGRGGGAEGGGLGILLAEVEPAAQGVIERDSIAAAGAARRDEEGNAFVNRVRRFLKAVRIVVPERKRLAATIEWTGFVAQTEKMLLRSEERRVGKECRSRWSPYH